MTAHGGSRTNPPCRNAALSCTARGTERNPGPNDLQGCELGLRVHLEPSLGPLDSGQYNAVVTTLLGFSQEVAVRVVGSADGATVDMRSASLSAFPDFGENGQRVEAFLLELDNQVTLMLRNAPTQPVAQD